MLIERAMTVKGILWLGLFTHWSTDGGDTDEAGAKAWPVPGCRTLWECGAFGMAYEAHKSSKKPFKQSGMLWFVLQTVLLLS